MIHQKQIYLPGLNSVRFIAAFMVILDHIELFKGYLGFQSFWSGDVSAYLGSFGVTIFFTLSGFLITYLLLQEKTVSNGNINIRNFYMRRILRIWPLYYLILILSFFILPHIGLLDMPVYGNGSDINQSFWSRLLLFVFLLPNVAFVWFPTVPFGNVLWSVGVEEQFYLFWPWLVKKIKTHVVKIAFICLAVYMIIRVVGILHYTRGGTPEFYMFTVRTRFSCMLIGAIAAGYTELPILRKKWVQWLSLFLFLAMAGKLLNFSLYNVFNSEIQSLVVAILLINIAFNSNSILKLENGLMNYLGKISYGMYVYHSIAVVISLKLMASWYDYINYPLWSLLILLLVLMLTIVMSHLSYFYFEKKLLNLKGNYATVISGDQVTEKQEEAIVKLQKKHSNAK